MRRLVAAASCAATLACARARVVAFDRDLGTFQVCGNGYAGRPTLDAEAQKECPAREADARACGVSQSTGGAFTDAYGNTTLRRYSYLCCTYRCR